MTYWDGGYVTLDVTDPANQKPLSDTDFAAADPARAKYGQMITPEGNAHQAESWRRAARTTGASRCTSTPTARRTSSDRTATAA